MTNLIPQSLTRTKMLTLVSITNPKKSSIFNKTFQAQKNNKRKINLSRSVKVKILLLRKRKRMMEKIIWMTLTKTQKKKLKGIE